jgi:hypothetical protein
MFKLWHDDTLRTEDVALRLGLSTGQLRKVAHGYGLHSRISTPSGEITDAPSEAEELLSRDSLALSPWVAARAAQFRRQKERDGEPMTVTIMETFATGQAARRRRARYA